MMWKQISLSLTHTQYTFWWLNQHFHRVKFLLSSSSSLHGEKFEGNLNGPVRKTIMIIIIIKYDSFDTNIIFNVIINDQKKLLLLLLLPFIFYLTGLLSVFECKCLMFFSSSPSYILHHSISDQKRKEKISRIGEKATTTEKTHQLSHDSDVHSLFILDATGLFFFCFFLFVHFGFCFKLFPFTSS